MKSILACPVLIIMAFLLPLSANAQTAGNSIYIEELTWPEVRDRVARGSTIAIIPIGGTEQGGPQLATGKHNSIMRYTSAEIARKVGRTLIAPLIPYSPSGRIEAPEGHMRFAGTLSVRDETLAMLLEDVATSLKQHGFKLICLIGDNSGSQQVQQTVAEGLTARWEAEGVRVLNVSAYDNNAALGRWAMENGTMTRDPMAHAGMGETSMLMAASPAQVRTGLIAAYRQQDYTATGAAGDASQSDANLGRGMLGLKVSGAIRQITQAAGFSE